MSGAEQNLFCLQNLELRIGYAFEDLGLLKRALTHRSHAAGHNERLEFLGDAILGMIIAKELYDHFPDCPEGDLTRMRSNLVREGTLAQLARGFGVGDALSLGPGEIKNGGSRRESLIADAMEAIIGAMFIDSGEDFPRVRQVVVSWFASRLRDIRPDETQKDHKSALQEFPQSRHRELPRYRVERVLGPENNQLFEVSVAVAGLPDFRGQGSSRRRAEQEAAGRALACLREHPQEE